MAKSGRTRLSNAQIDRLIRGTRIGGADRKAPSLAAARDYLTGRCRTVQDAADRNHTKRQAAARVVDQLRRLAAEDARRAGCVQVGVLIPGDAVAALAAWVGKRGGEVMR